MTKQRRPPTTTGPAGPVRVEAVRPLVAQVVAAAGLDLEDLRLQRAGSRLVLRVLVDRDGGVTLDEAAEVSRELAVLLDDSAMMGERAYVLDVGSPGVDRPLTALRHWQRNVGRLVRITTTDGQTLVGRIMAAEGPAAAGPADRVLVGTRSGQRTVASLEVRRAVVQVEFGEGQAED